MNANGIATADRIFANQLMREVKRREPINADCMHKGTRNWVDAWEGMYHVKDAGPIKSAKRLVTVYERMRSIPDKDSAFLPFVFSNPGKRTVIGIFMVMKEDDHPADAVAKTGVMVSQVILESTNTRYMLEMAPAMFVSWHALARMSERSPDLRRSSNRIETAVNILWQAAHTSFVMRNKLSEETLHLTVGDTILAGTLRPHVSKGKGRRINCTFYDIATVLPRDDMHELDPRRVQGDSVAEQIKKFLKAPSKALMKEIHKSIPLIAARKDDYTSRVLKEKGFDF